MAENSTSSKQDEDTIPGMSERDRGTALIAINVAAFTAGLAIGAIMPLITLSMELRGETADNIGYVVAAAPLALILTGPFINFIVSAFGLLGSMLLGSLLIVSTILTMPFLYGVPEWFILRFIAGVGIGALWILSETWVNAIATRENRGRVIAVFMLVMSLGFGFGPVMVSIVGPSEFKTLFFIAAVIILTSMVPLVMARKVAPTLGPAQNWSFIRAFRIAPLVMATALLAGITDSAQISFIPVYGVRMGYDTDIALYMLVAIIAGTMLSQIPIALYSHKIEYIKMLTLCLLLTFGFGVIVPFVMSNLVFLWPVLLLWGGSAFALYSIALILLGDRFSPSELAGANAAFVCVFEIGSSLGPISVGHAMEIMGPNGMPSVLAMACLPLIILATWRHFVRKSKRSD